MTPELTVLGLAALLQAAQYMSYSISSIGQTGVDYAFGPRDTQHVLTGAAGRLQRAFGNHFEALILFTIAVVLVTLSDKSTPLTAGCAWAYLGARILFVPAYVFGLTPWRSVIWAVGALASLIMIVSTLI